MKRVVRWGLVVAALLVVVIAAVQGVLWSDLPRRIVVSQLQQQLGVVVQIDELSAGWFGYARVRGVSVRLPIEADPIVTVPQLRVSHTSLLRLALGGKLKLYGVVAEQPVVTLRPLSDGRWNVEELIALFNAAGGGGGGGDVADALPNVAVHNATVVVRDAQGEERRLEEISLKAEHRPARLYAVRASVPGVGAVDGRIALRQDFEQTLNITVELRDELVRTWLGPNDWPRVAADGGWHGRIDSGRLIGRLTLTRAAANDLTMQGDVGLVVGDSKVRIEPAGLTVDWPGRLPDGVTAMGGVVTVDATHAAIEAVGLRSMEGEATLDGSMSWQAGEGQIAAQWDGVQWPGEMVQQGQLHGTLALAGKHWHQAHEVTLRLRSRAEGPTAWNVAMDGRVTGERWDALIGSVRFDTLTATMLDEHVDYSGLSSQFAVDGSQLTVSDLSWRDVETGGQVSGRAEADLAQRTWFGSLDAQGLLMPGLPEPVSRLERLKVQATGDAQAVRLIEASVAAAGVELLASGRYVYDDAQPLSVDVQLQRVELPRGDAADVVAAQSLQGAMTATGTVMPMDVAIVGALRARQLTVAHEPVGDVTLNLRGHLDERTASAQAEALQWFGGQWVMRGRYNRTGRTADVTVEAKDVDLVQVDEVIDRQLAIERGRADVRLTATELGSGRAAQMQGRFALRQVKRGIAEAEQVTGTLALHEGRLRVQNVQAKQGDGTFDGEAALALADPGRVEVTAQWNAWPVMLAQTQTTVISDGQLQGEVDWRQRQGSAQMSASARAMIGQEQAGQLQAAASLNGQVVTVSKLAGQAFGGTVDGQGRINLGDWLKSDASATWEDVSLDRLARIWPTLAGAAGRMGGQVTLRTTEDGRAIGPLELQAGWTTTGARYRELAVGDGQASVFFDDGRVVLHQLKTGTAGGAVELWGRLTRHGDGRWQAYVNGTAEDLDLATLMQTLPQRGNGMSVVGKAGGSLTLVSAVGDWDTAYGRGRLTLRESDLANIPLFTLLYNVVNIKLGDQAPDGEGWAEFRIEDGEVLVKGMRYRNRGGEVRLAGRVKDIRLGKASPIVGYALLSVRPLPDVDVFGPLNDVIVAMQADLTSVSIQGTVAEPVVRPTPFKGLRNAVRDLLGGE